MIGSFLFINSSAQKVHGVIDGDDEDDDDDEKNSQQSKKTHPLRVGLLDLKQSPAADIVVGNPATDESVTTESDDPKVAYKPTTTSVQNYKLLPRRRKKKIHWMHIL